MRRRRGFGRGGEAIDEELDALDTRNMRAEEFGIHTSGEVGWVSIHGMELLF